MPNISSSELIAQFQTPLRRAGGTSAARRAKSGRRHSRTPRAVNRQRNMVRNGSDTAWRTAPAFLRGRFGSSAGTAITAATPCSAVTAAPPAACLPENDRWRAAQTRHCRLQIQRLGGVSPRRIVHRRGHGHRSQRHGVWRCHVENRQRVDALGRAERRGLRRKRRTNCNE